MLGEQRLPLATKGTSINPANIEKLSRLSKAGRIDMTLQAVDSQEQLVT